jgi:hypothetical protein
MNPGIEHGVANHPHKKGRFLMLDILCIQIKAGLKEIIRRGRKPGRLFKRRIGMLERGIIK